METSKNSEDAFTSEEEMEAAEGLWILRVSFVTEGLERRASIVCRQEDLLGHCRLFSGRRALDDIGRQKDSPRVSSTDWWCDSSQSSSESQHEERRADSLSNKTSAVSEMAFVE